jgi:hypothetical protein
MHNEMESVVQKDVWDGNDVELEEEIHVIVKSNRKKNIQIEFVNNITSIIKMEGENSENLAEPKPY